VLFSSKIQRALTLPRRAYFFRRTLQWLDSPVKPGNDEGASHDSMSWAKSVSSALF
jgi:hypothetical protein